MASLREIMTTTVASAPSDTSVVEAALMMLRGRFGSIVVLQGSWLTGIFTERDVLRAAASGTDLNTSTIGEWMTKDPITAQPDTDSDEAAQIMLANGFRHLPVTEDEEVLGIVSLRDLLSTRIRRPRG